MKLFAIYIGGQVEGANIELHDMRFVLAERIEDTYDELRRQWWGTPKTLHLDCWSELTRADGYAISLKPTPPEEDRKLYYVNLGGYDTREFTEVHKNVFVVARNEAEAKRRALAGVKHWDQPHKDDMYEAEQAFCINQATEAAALYIHLTPMDDPSPAPFTCHYKPIGRTK